ncbi:MAG: SDR family NAD(P)-dependent oxidoreductase, partial [Oceanipulchritudo sp.]
MGDLRGKRALVTAGGQGIGLAITKALLRSGCSVVLHYLSSKVDLEELRRETGAGGEVVLGQNQADLRDPGEADSLVGSAVEILGGLDILVNNAGSLVERR